MKKVNIYAACDRAIQEMNRANLEAFGRLKLAKWDEIHIIRTVTTVYRTSMKRARKRYYEVAFEAYLLAMAMCEVDAKEAHKMAEKVITDEWIDKIMTRTDLLTLYRFDTETERKAYRLAEELEVTQDRARAIDIALRYWSKQCGQYAINVTDYAVIQAFKDAGVKKVQWVTVNDEKRCHECGSMDGKIYSIDEVPPKPHLNCRCRLIPVLDS